MGFLDDLFGGSVAEAAAESALAIIQIELYRRGFKKYRQIMTGMADDASRRAKENFMVYESLRAKDLEFYRYYCALPEYEECDSNVNRAKGIGWAKYGQNVRRINKQVRGYQPLSRVGLTQQLGRQPLAEAGLRRVADRMTERSRVDNHYWLRWGAIIGSPTDAAEYVNTALAVAASRRTLQAYGQGINSAGLALGNALYKFTETDEERERRINGS